MELKLNIKNKKHDKILEIEPDVIKILHKLEIQNIYPIEVVPYIKSVSSVDYFLGTIFYMMRKRNLEIINDNIYILKKDNYKKFEKQVIKVLKINCEFKETFTETIISVNEIIELLKNENTLEEFLEETELIFKNLNVPSIDISTKELSLLKYYFKYVDNDMSPYNLYLKYDKDDYIEYDSILKMILRKDINLNQKEESTNDNIYILFNLLNNDKY